MFFPSLKTYPAAMRADPQTMRIIQDNCIRCHNDTVESIVAGTQPYASAQGMPFDRNCWYCHRSVVHGERGMTLYPYQDSEVYNK